MGGGCPTYYTLINVSELARVDGYGLVFIDFWVLLDYCIHALSVIHFGRASL